MIVSLKQHGGYTHYSGISHYQRQHFQYHLLSSVCCQVASGGLGDYKNPSSRAALSSLPTQFWPKAQWPTVGCAVLD